MSAFPPLPLPRPACPPLMAAPHGEPLLGPGPVSTASSHCATLLIFKIILLAPHHLLIMHFCGTILIDRLWFGFVGQFAFRQDRQGAPGLSPQQRCQVATHEPATLPSGAAKTPEHEAGLGGGTSGSHYCSPVPGQGPPGEAGPFSWASRLRRSSRSSLLTSLRRCCRNSS